MTILDRAVQLRRLRLEQLCSRGMELGLRTVSESVEFVREDRDAR